MKRKFAIIVTAFLFVAVGSLCVLHDQKEAQATPDPSAVIVLTDDSLMLVFYFTANEEYLNQARGPATFVIEANKMYMDGQVIINNMTKVSYGIFVWQKIELKYEWDDELDVEVPVPQYMAELDLQPIGVDDLPHSQHIAKLIGIDQQVAKPAIVARKFLGEVYTVNCLVSQSALDMYLAGDLKLGDYVIVSFIDEIPDTTELNIAIVVDKVVDTWSK